MTAVPLSLFTEIYMPVFDLNIHTDPVCESLSVTCGLVLCPTVQEHIWSARHRENDCFYFLNFPVFLHLPQP